MNYRVNTFDRFMAGFVDEDFTQWLFENGFFNAPASAGHHGAVEGGLFDHSVCTAEALVDLTNKLNLHWDNPRSPYIVGMFHDLCKIDAYKPNILNLDGSTATYTYNNDFLISGHGDKSIMYLAQHMQLTEEEILCIRWHMGAFDEKDNWKYYSAAVRKYPNVLYTHTADMMASQIMGI